MNGRRKHVGSAPRMNRLTMTSRMAPRQPARPVPVVGPLAIARALS